MLEQINKTVLIRLDLRKLAVLDIDSIASKQIFPIIDDFKSFKEHRKLTYLGGRLALYHYLALQAAQYLHLPIVKEEHGKPNFVLADNTELNVHFNISHSMNYLYVMVGNYDLGVDIEVVKTRKNFTALKRQVLNDVELSYLAESSTEYDEYLKFFKLWTIKETLVKTTGRGLVGLKDFDFYPNEHIIKNISDHISLRGMVKTIILSREELNDSFDYSLSWYQPNLISNDQDSNFMSIEHMEFNPKTFEFSKIRTNLLQENNSAIETMFLK